jgi:transposase
MIEYKCKLEGIKVILINEAYTSKCSALDFKEIGKKEKYLGQRIKRGLFETKDGLLINADINASINILRNASTNGDRDITNVVEDLWGSPVRLNIGDNPVYLTKLIK